MRVMVVLGGLALAAALALPVSAAAGGASAIAGAPVLTNPALPAPPRVPKELVGPDPIYQRGRFDQDRPRDRDRPGRRPTTIVTVFPQPIFVAPNRCWYPGHWTYQWVPQWTAYNAWVDQQMTPDGEWVGGYYERRWHPSGSYQPYWVDGYYDGC